MTTTRNFALEVERSEQKLLRDIAEATENTGVRGVLSRIANDEQDTISQISNLCTMGNESACIQTGDLEMSNNFPLGLMDPEKIAHELHDSVEAYRFVMEMEKDIEQVYQNALNGTQNGSVREALERVLEIKKHEMQDVENMFLNANAPNENLEWGEFGNTEEFHQFGRDLY